MKNPLKEDIKIIPVIIEAMESFHLVSWFHFQSSIKRRSLRSLEGKGPKARNKEREREQRKIQKIQVL